MSAYVGMTFGRLNVVLQNQTVIVQHCKKTLNNIAKLKLFLNKSIMVDALLGPGVNPLEGSPK